MAQQLWERHRVSNLWSCTRPLWATKKIRWSHRLRPLRRTASSTTYTHNTFDRWLAFSSSFDPRWCCEQLWTPTRGHRSLTNCICFLKKKILYSEKYWKQKNIFLPAEKHTLLRWVDRWHRLSHFCIQQGSIKSCKKKVQNFTTYFFTVNGDLFHVS